MSDPDLQRQTQELEQRGADAVRRALAGRDAIAGVDRAFAQTWLLQQDLRRLRRELWVARVRTAFGVVAAVAAIIMLIEVLLDWLF